MSFGAAETSLRQSSQAYPVAVVAFLSSRPFTMGTRSQN